MGGWILHPVTLVVRVVSVMTHVVEVARVDRELVGGDVSGVGI